MSRDWTPRETYLVEKHDLETNSGIGSIWDFMENAAWVVGGKNIPLHTAEEVSLRKEYPVLGKFLESFMDLYTRLSEFDGGLDLLKKKDSELALYIETGKGDPGSYLVKWFEGKLDEGFYYRERNNELLIAAICQEALDLGMCNWIVTDPDCLQVRRQVGYEDRGIFQLMQVNVIAGEGLEEDSRYCLAWAEIDIEDYSQEEINNTLNSYGYENFKELVEAAGSRNEAYAQLAEMFFEDQALECHVQDFTKWNEALDEIQNRAGVDLTALRENEDKNLLSIIRDAEAASKACRSSFAEKTSRAEHEEVL